MSIRLQGLRTNGITALIGSAYVGSLIDAAENGIGELVTSKSFTILPFAVMGLGLFSPAFRESSKRFPESEGINLSPT